MHPYDSLLLLNSPASALNAPEMRYSPLYDVLMLMAPGDNLDEGLAAMAGSTIGIILAHYVQSES